MNLHNLFRLIISLITVSIALSAAAFDPSLYATESVLSSGRWVKISVKDSGLYRIPAATLRRWGFNDASSVRIHGYGGRRIDDALTEVNYTDDLPVVSTAVCNDG